MEDVELKVNKVSKRIILKVTVRTTREYRVRQWIAIKLMRLSARILDARIEITTIRGT